MKAQSLCKPSVPCHSLVSVSHGPPTAWRPRGNVAVVSPPQLPLSRGPTPQVRRELGHRAHKYISPCSVWTMSYRDWSRTCGLKGSSCHILLSTNLPRQPPNSTHSALPSARITGLHHSTRPSTTSTTCTTSFSSF